MKFRPVLPLVVLLSAPLANAQTAPVPPVTPPVTAPAPESVQFTTKLTPGSIRSYKVTVDQKGTLSIPGSGQTMPIDAKVTSYVKMIVDKQNADGTYAAHIKLGGVKMTSNSPMPMPPVQDSYEVKGTIGKDGLFTADPTVDKKPGNALGMSPAETMTGIFRSLSAVPLTSVAVGDSWSSVIPLPLDPSGKSQIAVTSKLLGVDAVTGDRVARVQRDIEGPVNLQLTEPMPLSITGTMKGSGVSKVSVTSGQPLQDDSKVHLKMTIQAPNSAGNGEQTNMGLDMDLTTKVESSVADVKPKANAK
ncbi:MAG TPA: hypothetical protein VGM37_13700 [Armatimonadota bacterium]|jgi:hypothetical protein